MFYKILILITLSLNLLNASINDKDDGRFYFNMNNLDFGKNINQVLFGKELLFTQEECSSYFGLTQDLNIYCYIYNEDITFNNESFTLNIITLNDQVYRYNLLKKKSKSKLDNAFIKSLFRDYYVFDTNFLENTENDSIHSFSNYESFIKFKNDKISKLKEKTNLDTLFISNKYININNYSDLVNTLDKDKSFMIEVNELFLNDKENSWHILIDISQ